MQKGLSCHLFLQTDLTFEHIRLYNTTDMLQTSTYITELRRERDLMAADA